MATEEDQFEKLACGKWTFIRDENTDVCMKDMGYPDEVVAFIMGTKPKMHVERDGDSFRFTYELVPGKAQKFTFKLNEPVDVKDDNDPPMYHNKETFSIENGTAKIISISQLPGKLKIDTETHIVRKGNEMHTLMGKVGDRSVVGNRVLVLDQ